MAKDGQNGTQCQQNRDDGFEANGRRTWPAAPAFLSHGGLLLRTLTKSRKQPKNQNASKAKTNINRDEC
jgi:hypothetical protein